MASIRNLTRIFALVNRKMVRRSSFRFGLLVGYGFAVMILRLLANTWTVLPVFTRHPEYACSGFFAASFALVSFYGICIIPLIAARSTAGILGHPRLSRTGTWRLTAAHTLFTISRFPFLGLVAVLAVYSAGFAACEGKPVMGFVLFVAFSASFVAGNIAFHIIFRRLSIRLPEAEVLLLALVALAVFANPQPVFRNGVVTLSLGAPPRGFGAGTVLLAQPALLVLDFIVLGVLRLLDRLEAGIRHRFVKQAFTRLVFGRLPLTLPALTAFAEWYILAWPAEAWIKAILAGGLALYTLVRMADAFIGAGDDIFVLFRRRAEVRHFLLPALVYAGLLAVPLLGSTV